MSEKVVDIKIEQSDIQLLESIVIRDRERNRHKEFKYAPGTTIGPFYIMQHDTTWRRDKHPRYICKHNDKIEVIEERVLDTLNG